ncbi:MAG TPA: VWA domain-containing protein [Blastocatellia bacterium]|nr:VWA domain-containing protein [Blastocatellia bacterium]
MSKNERPRIEVITHRPLAVAGKEQTLDLLIRVTPPAVTSAGRRRKLNLSLALDRSGSMEGEKIARAREAASYCVDQLLPDDRVSLVIFDDVVEVLVPSQLVENKEAIKERINRVRARNSTALHEAWVRSGMQVSEHLTQGAVNRVLLITDGLANVGETNVDRIVSQAGELAERGVSTSTIGIGRDFNEDLLIPMAEHGRGNAWHVAEPQDMERIFATELEGLIAQIGHTVSLGLSPAEGVKIQDVLNDFEVTHTGRYKLPNLLAGSPIDVVIRVRVPARRAGERYKILDMRLAWNPQGAPSSEREMLNESVTIEFAEAEEVEHSAEDERVIIAAELLMAARARREAIEQLDRGEVASARATIARSSERFAEVCAPMMAASEVREQVVMFEDLEADLASGADLKMARKKMSYQSYTLSRQSKPLK